MGYVPCHLGRISTDEQREKKLKKAASEGRAEIWAFPYLLKIEEEKEEDLYWYCYFG
jgi:hypothetical protein